MKQSKKILAFVLILTMVVSLFTFLPVSSSAAAHDFLVLDFSDATSVNVANEIGNKSRTNEGVHIEYWNSTHSLISGRSNYILSVHKNNAATYNTDYKFVVAEYRATGASLSTHLYIESFSHANSKQDLGAITVGAWAYTNPVQLNDSLLVQIPKPGNVGVYFTETATSGVSFDMGRFLFFKTAEAANAFISTAKLMPYQVWDFMEVGNDKSTVAMTSNGTTDGEGYWTLTNDGVRITYMPTLLGGSWGSHYLAQARFRASNQYDTDCNVMMVEYRATTTSSNVKLVVKSLGGDLSTTEFDIAATSNWTFTEPVKMSSTWNDRLTSAMNVGIYVTDDATNSVYEVSRVMFFRTMAAANEYKAAVADNSIASDYITWNFADPDSYTLGNPIAPFNNRDYVLMNTTSETESETLGYVSLDFAQDSLDYNTDRSVDHQTAYQLKSRFNDANSITKAYRYMVVDYRVAALADTNPVLFRFVNDYTGAGSAVTITNVTSADVGVWKHSPVVVIPDSEATDRHNYFVRMNMPQDVSFQFKSAVNGSEFQISEVRFFKDKNAALAYANTSFAAATDVNVKVTAMDYDTKSVTLKAVPVPTASSSSITWSVASGTPASTTVNADGTYTVKLANLTDTVTVRASAGSTVYEDSVVKFMDYQEWDFSDASSVQIASTGLVDGQGYWTRDEALTVTYMPTLLGGSWGSHYLTQPQFPNVGDYNEDYKYVMFEYAAETDATSANLVFQPLGGGKYGNVPGGQTIRFDISSTLNQGLVLSDAYEVGHEFRGRLYGRSDGAKNIGLYFEDSTTDAKYTVTRILFFKTKLEADAYKAATTLPAENVIADVASVDYTTKTVTVDSMIVPANATATPVVSVISGADQVDSISGNAVTFKNFGVYTLRVTADNETEDLAFAMNDKFVMDFADFTNVELFQSTVVGQYGDGNNAPNVPNYAGYGVWEKTATGIELGYQNILQHTGHASYPDGRYGHYLMKIRMPYGIKYDTAYKYFVVEYKATNASASGVSLYLESDGHGPGATNETGALIDTSNGWHMTDPIAVTKDVATRLNTEWTNPNRKGHLSFYINDTKADAKYEIARILFFRTEADALGYKAAAASTSFAEDIQNVTTDPMYSNTGESATLEAFVKPVTTAQDVTWSLVEGADVAVLNGAELTFLTAGSAKVRATAANGYFEEFVFHAVAKPEPAVSIVTSKDAITIGNSIDFGVVTYDLDVKSVNWTLTDANNNVLATKEGSKVFSYSFVNSGTYTAIATVKGSVVNGPASYEATVRAVVTVTDDTALDGWMITQAMHQHLTNNTKTVIFRDADGNVISEQKVTYGNSAKVPVYGVDYNLPLDKVMTGWSDESFNYVTKDIDTQIVLVDPDDFDLDAFLADKQKPAVIETPVVDEENEVSAENLEKLKSTVVWDFSSKFAMQQSGIGFYEHDGKEEGVYAFDNSAQGLKLNFAGTHQHWGSYRAMIGQTAEAGNQLTNNHQWVVLVYKADADANHEIKLENNGTLKETVLVSDASVSRGMWTVSVPVQLEASFNGRLQTVWEGRKLLAHITLSMDAGARSNTNVWIKGLVFCESKEQAQLYIDQLTDNYGGSFGILEMKKYN